ncbi:MAG: adenylosuccinate synthase [Nitrospirae bacterium]|nr:adenylosuccinate synthase [Nitrospirota bacterium]
MPNIVVVGAQWGDEGKGKIIDILAKDAGVVARYQGGHNAGHTVVVNDEEYILHLIPSGIIHPGKICMIGNGVVIDPEALIGEIEGLKSRGIAIDNNLFISKNSHLIMPYHSIIDKESERSKSIGTTGRGIGPAYVDKVARTGIRMSDLLDSHLFREKLELNLSNMNYLLYNVYKSEQLDLEEIYSKYMGYAQKIGKYITDVSILINKYIEENMNILFEGAQGTLLDVDHGTYPYVTSSNAIAGGACTGLGIGPTKIDGVLGVSKAYTTRVGSGPFPTELKDKLGNDLRSKGREYGATTGRPRRCGWLDVVVVRYSVIINGMSGIALTKLDILDEYPKIKICVGYKYKGNIYNEMPHESSVLWNCEPVYEEIEGWQESTVGIKRFDSLPKKAKVYIRRVEDLVGVKIDIISTSQRRDDTIIKRNPFRDY